MKTYTIGDISRKLNVSTDAVRYYDKEGLLPFVKRNSSGRREFTDIIKKRKQKTCALCFRFFSFISQ